MHLHRHAVTAGALAGITASLAGAVAYADVTPGEPEIGPTEPVRLAALATAENKGVRLAAAAGWTAWSDRSNGRFALQLRSPAGAISSPAAVARSSTPIRVALTRRSSGQIQAAYDVCTKTGCRIKVLDVATGAVRTLPLPAGTSSAELPALAGDTLAFIGRPKGKRAWSTARVMTVKLAGDRAVTRWSAKTARGNGPLQLAIQGAAVAALWQHGAEERLEVQRTPSVKPRRLDVARDDEGCCTYRSFESLAFAGPGTVSVLFTGLMKLDTYWTVLRYSAVTGKRLGSGPYGKAIGPATSADGLAEDGAGRTVVLAADLKHRYGVYEFAAP